MSAHWVDLGDGEAISATRIAELEVLRPFGPSELAYLRHRPFLDMLTWTVTVLDGRDMVRTTVGYYWAEDDARAHARRIIAQMHEAA